MKKSEECSYLGDILSVKGSVDEKIERKRQISGMINGLSLGHYYIKIVFVLRETMLLNGTLTNIEV